ncbi:MAG TPA: M28 family peptidase [Acidobacteriota bacterium]|nr:M28 family peptidase [Acidobacteriota bacterium]
MARNPATSVYRVLALTALLALLAWACQTSEPAETLSKESYSEYLRTLSGDEYEGRAPATPGGSKAAEYIRDKFQAFGLQPVNGDSFYQQVSLVGMTASSDLTLEIGGAARHSLRMPQDAVAWAGVEEERIEVSDADLVFVGYGVNAPEAHWDDYKGHDVEGKVLLMLVNDPPSDDPTHFGGKALTYYGRWTYKLEEAARRGAVGVMLIHETEMAGYPWGVVVNSWTGEQMSLPAQGEKSTRFESWIKNQRADELLKAAGSSFQEAREKASSPEFEPIDLPFKVSVAFDNAIRRAEAPNVLAKLEGSDPELKEQVVIVTSHYDHLGKAEATVDFRNQDDLIYNGAFDNASGTAALLEMARVMVSWPHERRPKRSVIFAAVTAEEQGLLGSQYYAQNPLVPLSETQANINIDGVNVWGPAEDIVAMGAERSTLEPLVQQVAGEMEMTLSPDPSPEKGYYFRSDHFNFVKVGVPSVYLDMGLQFRDKPDDWGRKLMEDYVANHYHQPSDEFDPEWPLTGALQLMEFTMKVIERVGNAEDMMQWREGDPFYEMRRRQLQAGS